jgi:hypothetical protein
MRRIGGDASQRALKNRAGVISVIEAADQIGRWHRRMSAEHPHEVGGERGLRLAVRPCLSLLVEIEQGRRGRGGMCMLTAKM